MTDESERSHGWIERELYQALERAGGIPDEPATPDPRRGAGPHVPVEQSELTFDGRPLPDGAHVEITWDRRRRKRKGRDHDPWEMVVTAQVSEDDLAEGADTWVAVAQKAEDEHVPIDIRITRPDDFIEGEGLVNEPIVYEVFEMAHPEFRAGMRRTRVTVRLRGVGPMRLHPRKRRRRRP